MCDVLQRYRRPGQTWADIADVAVRVFFRKFNKLMNLILKKHIFGKVAGHAYSIELQQRGECLTFVVITRFQCIRYSL